MTLCDFDIFRTKQSLQNVRCIPSKPLLNQQRHNAYLSSFAQKIPEDRNANELLVGVLPCGFSSRKRETTDSQELARPVFYSSKYTPHELRNCMTHPRSSLSVSLVLQAIIKGD